MPRLFSYVVDHDLGYAPNPYGGICTLVHCKFGGANGKRNIVELAEVGDWILGSGGTSRQSAGNRKIIYVMRVDEKPEFDRYLRDVRFIGRQDHVDRGDENMFALISHHYFYFGRNAIGVSALPESIPLQDLFKRGSSFRCDYPGSALTTLIAWFERTYEVGMHGDPCAAGIGAMTPRQRVVPHCTDGALPRPRCGRLGG